MAVTLKRSAFEASLAEGNTVKQMAEELGVGQQSIRDAAKHWGISLRKKPVKSKQVQFVDDTNTDTQNTTVDAAFSTAPTTVTLEE